MDIRQTNCPSRHKNWGGLGGRQFRSLGKLSNWHQLWFTTADSSGDGHRLKKQKTSRHQYHRGHWGGGVRGSQIQKSGQAVKRLGRLAPNLVHVCGFVWNGHRLNTIRPFITRGHLGGGYGVTNSKLSGSCQRAAPIGTKFGTRVQIHLGMDMPLETQGGAWVFLGVKHSTNWGSCQTPAPMGTKFGTRRRLRLGMDIGKIQFAPHPRRHFGGRLGSHKFKSRKAAKRLDRLAPNLVHVCGFIWEWT